MAYGMRVGLPSPSVHSPQSAGDAHACFYCSLNSLLVCIYVMYAYPVTRFYSVLCNCLVCDMMYVYVTLTLTQLNDIIDHCTSNDAVSGCCGLPSCGAGIPTLLPGARPPT